MPTFKHPCPACGKLIARDAARCPFCGSVDPFVPGRCPKCQAPIEDAAWVACAKCGTPLKDGVTPMPGARRRHRRDRGPVLAPPAPPVLAPPAPPSPTGAPAPAAGPRPGASFCTVCGTLAG